MKYTKTLILLAVASTLLIAGCKTSRIMNVNAPIHEAPSGELTMDEVADAIIKAGKGLGWEVHPKSSGHMVATRNHRTHQAAVDINYTPQDYSIRYRSSVNLKYDGTNIHKQYNNWVSNLASAIDATIASAQYK